MAATMQDAVKRLRYVYSTEGVDQVVNDNNKVSGAITTSLNAQQQAYQNVTRQQQTYQNSVAQATAGSQAFGKSIADHASDLLNHINHLKLIALGAYALFPAFRSFVNAEIMQGLGLLGTQLGVIATVIGRVVAFSAPALAFFSRIALPIGAAVAAFEALNYVLKLGADLLEKYSIAGQRALFEPSGFEDKLKELTKFQTETISSTQVQNAIELGKRLDAAKNTINEFFKVQLDLTNLALKFQAVWVSIAEIIAKAVEPLNKIPWETIGKILAYSPAFLLPTLITNSLSAGPGSAASQPGLSYRPEPPQIDALTRARQTLAAGLGGAFTGRFTAVGEKPKELDTKTAADEFDRLTASIQRHIAATEADAQTEGKGAEAVARLRTEFRLQEAAQQDIVKNGGKLEDYADKIAKVAERAAAAAAALERAKIASDIDFGRKTALLSPEDVQIAQQLKGLYGNDVPAALNSTYAAQLRVNDQLRQTRSAADEFVNSASSSLTSSLADITTGAKNASDAFKDLSTAVIRSLEEMIIKMTITIPIARALQSAIGGFLPGGAGLGPASPASGSYFAGTGFHSGGIVGSEGTTRYIHPAYFDDAPRFHAGLMANEVPAILTRDESVLTPGQMAAIGGRSAVEVNVNVQNNSSAQVSVDQKKNQSGGVDLIFIVEQAEAQIASKVSDGRGALNSALTNRYGLRPRFSG
jgi:hypothetical protein